MKRPVFIVGCPRSGTSVFGRTLGQTPHFLYLHEPRRIWCHVNPRLDIWAYRHPIEQGQLYWSEADVKRNEARQLQRWFQLELFATRRQRLIEKMPLNVFRLNWLRAIFPDAQFIHLIRHGRDVALSLAQAVGRWFPAGYWEQSRHFTLFTDYAATRPEWADKLAFLPPASTNYERSLLVWWLAVMVGRETGRFLPPHQYLELRYETMITHPRASLEQLYAFLGEPLPPAVAENASQTFHTDSLHKPDPNPTFTHQLAGALLAELGYDD